MPRDLSRWELRDGQAEAQRLRRLLGPYWVDPAKLDPVFLNFGDSRAAQKAAFKGEFFPSSMMCTDVGRSFVDFFQLDRFTGKQKGIISIPLSADPLLSGKVQP